MKVSIVTAVRNGASAIGYSLDSVKQQSFPRIEHIVIDGASTDNTVEVVSRNSARVSKVVSEADSGVYEAFNKGLKASTGDIVAYLNAGDEYVDSNVVQRVVDEFEVSNAAAVFGDLVIVDEVHRARIVRLYRSSRFNPSRVRFGLMPAHPTLFVRRDIYEKFGGYDASYRIAGDFELVTRLFAHHRISYSYVPQILVRMPRGGLSTSGPRANWIITREMQRACGSNGVQTSLFNLLLRLPLKFAELRHS